MSYKVFYDENSQIVHAVISGELIASVTSAAAIEGLKLSREKDCYRFLVDMRETIAKDSTIETYMFMEGLAQIGFERTDIIAILYLKDDEKHKFAEIVAHNRGWRNIRYFCEISEAEKWLTQNK